MVFTRPSAPRPRPRAWACEATRRVRKTSKKDSGTRAPQKDAPFEDQRGKTESRPRRQPISTRAMRCDVGAPRARHRGGRDHVDDLLPRPRRWRRAMRAAAAARAWRGSAIWYPPCMGRFWSQRKRTAAAVKTRRAGSRRVSAPTRAARDRRGGRPGRGRTGGGSGRIGA